MPLLPLLPPTRPLLIWAVLALACAVVLTVEGVLLFSGRTRQLPGWRFGVLLLLGSLLAVALAARLYDIHAELIRVRCNCEPFQWTEPDLATPLHPRYPLGQRRARVHRVWKCAHAPVLPLADCPRRAALPGKRAVRGLLHACAPRRRGCLDQCECPASPGRECILD